jgi:predicted dienelactone hydrolase
MFAFPLLSPTLLAAVMTFAAGQRTFTFEAPQVTAQLGVASAQIHGLVWYPVDAGATETPQSVGDSKALFDAGSAAVDAPIATAPAVFPLVLLSHGTGGAARQMAWLGTALARAGFIAVAIDHPGNSGAAETTVQGFTLWWLRPRELSLALDAAFADPSVGPRVDRARIGAAGFSLGGYTAIALGGASVDVAAFHAYCAQHPTAAGNCQPPPEFPELISKMNALLASDPSYAKAMTSGGGDVSDSRVRSVYAIAPAVGESVTVASLRAISVPVRVVFGTNDVTVAPPQNALRYASAIPGATLMTVPGAGHYTFLDTCTADGKALIPGPVCTDGPGVDREAIHAQVARDAIAFFEKTLGP